MKTRNSTKSKLLSSVIALVLCVSMLIGATFAWFTDTASTAVNKIQAGNLDIQLLAEDGTTSLEGKTLSWQKVAGHENESVLWEPGCTYKLQPIVIKNAGNLILKYKITITGIQGSAKLNEAIDWTIVEKDANGNELSTALGADHTLAPGAFNTLTIQGTMRTDAGNEYQGLSIDNIGITVMATQQTGEYDSFDYIYDQNAVYPVIPVLSNTTATGNITVLSGGTLGNMNDDNSPTAAQISVPEGAVTVDTNAVFSMQLTESNPDSVTYEISLKDNSGTAVALSKPAVVTANIGTNLINVKVKHSGEEMTEETTGADGTYQYDRGTGVLTIYTKTFSPFEVSYEFDGVASLNGVAYPSINAAIKAAKNGDTVVVMKDYTSSNILINLVPEAGKAITVDLNGKTLTYTGTDRAVQVAYAGANLTIKNGTIDKGNEALGVVALIAPTVNLDNVIINGAPIAVYGYSGATLNMNKVTINANEKSTLYGAVYTVLNTKLNMTECNVTSSNIGVMSENVGNVISIDKSTINSNYYGVYHNGSFAPCNVTIKNSQIKDTDGTGVYISNSAGRALQTLTIDGCTISGPTAVEMKHTNATITNSTLIGTATPTGSGSNNNGACTAGYALAVTTNGVTDYVTGTVSVSNTKFYSGATTEGESNGYVFVYQVADDASVSIDGTKYSNYNTYDRISVNPSNIQDYLDGKYGSIDGKTLVLSAGTYGKLELGRATKYAGSNTEYYIGGISAENKKTFDEFLAIKNSGTWSASAYYVRNMSNVTLKAADGAAVSVAGLIGSSGHVYGNVYDYVLDKAYTSGSAYYLTQNWKNITIEGITFTSKVDISSSLDTTEIDGVTFKNCTFNIGSTASDNQALRYYNENNNGKVKNLTVDSCKFNTCYQGVYTQKINGVTVKNCTFNTTGHNAIAVQSGSEAVNHKAVVITGNTFTEIGDRIIRFGDVGADTQITIQNNTATNSGDSSGQVIKAQSLANGVTYNISGNNWGKGTIVPNTELADRTA